MLAPLSLPLFVYGTLLDATFVGNLLGRPFVPEPAELLDFQLLELPGLAYPVIQEASGRKVEGRLYRHLTEEDFERLDAYEGVAEGLYQRTAGEITTPATADRGSTERAWIYVPTVQTLSRYG